MSGGEGFSYTGVLISAAPLSPTWAMMLIGLVAIGLIVYRRQKKGATVYRSRVTNTLSDFEETAGRRSFFSSKVKKLNLVDVCIGTKRDVGGPPVGVRFRG